MIISPNETSREVDWNVLTSPWLEVLTHNAEIEVCSPLEALKRANAIRCIAAASPLDLFAAHRFLLTLLYWKADAAGGIQQVRNSLLKGEVPQLLLGAIEANAGCFHLFDKKEPFLQDTSLSHPKKQNEKSAGSFFAEFACGTNIAHFHHGDDDEMRLCLRCAIIGLMRVVPWSQSGGAGLSPSIHNAPPIVTLASGVSLVETLGLNFVPLALNSGTAKWTGHFVPTDKNAPIPYLQAFTWNPRRIHLLSPKTGAFCWRCGRTDGALVGPIVSLKNQETKKRTDKKLFEWQDPAAFYGKEEPFKTMKSGMDRKTQEPTAFFGHDLWFLEETNNAKSLVATANLQHQAWKLIIPSSNPANNKTFDHRQLDLRNFSPEVIRGLLPAHEVPKGFKGQDGWVVPRPSAFLAGSARFVRAAVYHLTTGDWAVLSAAAFQKLHEAPAAFDLLAGLLWPLRKKVKGLPSRNVAWLMLKLMAFVPARARICHTNAVFNPSQELPKRQWDGRYPMAFPRGNRLELALRWELDKNMRRRTPQQIDWAAVCDGLNQLLD